MKPKGAEDLQSWVVPPKKGIRNENGFQLPRCKQTHNLETSVITLSQAVNAEKCSNEKSIAVGPARQASLSVVEKP